MATKGICDTVKFVEEGERVFYIDSEDDTIILPKAGLSEYCEEQLRSLLAEV